MFMFLFLGMGLCLLLSYTANAWSIDDLFHTFATTTWELAIAQYKHSLIS